jgi:hypothetical protein
MYQLACWCVLHRSQMTFASFTTSLQYATNGANSADFFLCKRHGSCSGIHWPKPWKSFFTVVDRKKYKLGVKEGIRFFIAWGVIRRTLCIHFEKDWYVHFLLVPNFLRYENIFLNKNQCNQLCILYFFITTDVFAAFSRSYETVRLPTSLARLSDAQIPDIHSSSVNTIHVPVKRGIEMCLVKYASEL